jgi:ATP-dependent RNA helicase SUPV3L1/SUV3
LWDVCRIPDFRSISEAEHATLLARIFGFLSDGQVPNDWIAQAVARIDRTEGDIDTLSKRLAYIRTYTYVAQRKGWVQDESHWRGETRAVEDRLSDALHAALTKAFVDRRTSLLMRRLKQRESLVAEVNDKGEVTVEGEFVGRLEGFRFRQDATATTDEARMLRAAAVQALRPEFHLRADRFYNAPDTEVDFTAQGGLMWGSNAVGKLVKGVDALHPLAEPFVDEDAGPEVLEKVRRRLQHFIDRKVAALFEPLTALQKDETLQGLARGFAYRLIESLGVLPREAVAEEAKALDQEARSGLRKHGIRFGQFTIFQPLLLKPKPTALRLVLWCLANGVEDMPESPPPGLVTIPNLPAVPRGHYTLAGYHPAGARAIRIDMLERLADLLRARDSRAGFEATPEMLSITGMTLEQFSGLMEGLGYRGVRGERAKVRAEIAAPAVTEPGAEGAVADAAAPVAEVQAVAPVPDAPVPDAPVPDAAAAEAPAAAVETEVFYTFTWAPRPRADRHPQRPHRGEGQTDRPRGPRRPHRHAETPGPSRDAAPAVEAAVASPGADAPRPDTPRPDTPRPDAPRHDRPRHKHGTKPQGERQGERPRGKPDRPPREGQGNRDDRKGPKPTGDDRPKTFEARPPRAERPVDPDSPFAVLAALKGRI